MADKSTNFVIKVNSKEVDLAKTSFKDFKKIIADAKKELQSLPVSDPRYKQLATDINGAEKAWKEATKAAADFGDENQKGEEQVKSYRLQVREATIALQSAEQQFGKNSDEANKLRETLKDLKDQQDDFNETTRKLDDSLAGIPGPIGKVGQAMQQFGEISNNAKSALATLGQQFNTTDKILKGTLIGFIVGLLVTLVAAVMDAAKSFKPLQDAMASFGDAIGAVFDALKPLTDFILNIVVGAVKLLATVITSVAEAFGGVNAGFKKTTLELDREIKKQETLLNNYGTFLSEYYTSQLNLLKKFNEDKKAVYEDETKTVDQKNKDIFALENKFLAEKSILEKQREKITRDSENNVANINKQAAINGIDNQRQSEVASLNSQKEFQTAQANSEIKAANGRIIRTNVLIKTLKSKDAAYYKDTIEALEKSVEDEKNLVKNLSNESVAQQNQVNSELSKVRRERLREDVNIIKQRSLTIQELSTQLIRNEFERDLQAAKDNREAIKEQNRLELEQAELAGVSLKNLKQKQNAELLVANEQIRKAQIQLDADIFQQQIDVQNRLAIESEVNTKEYFDARSKQLALQFEKELLLADGNRNDVLNARNRYWRDLFELDQQKIQAQIDQLQLEFNSLSEGTTEFFDKQRAIEKKNFELQEMIAQSNYEKLEALNKQHQRNMALIDASQIQAKADLQMRAFMVLGTMREEFFEAAIASENSFYEAEKIRAGDNADALAVIELEHFKRIKQIDADRIEAKNSVYAAIAQIAQEFANILSDIAQQELQSAQGTDKAKFESAKKFAKTALIIERAAAIAQIVANTGIANAKAVAVSPVTFGQPWVTINTISAAVSIAGIIASAVKGINDLNSQQFQPAGESGSGGGANSNRMGRGYAKGGVIDGQRHSQGGVLIEAEGGEAVMTRGAVSMFGPMLNMMNQMGGGANFAPNLTTTLMDKPIVSNPSEQQAPIIMKTYVVEKDLTDVQQRQARLKELSTL
jgi:hypothetical protein